MRTRTFSKEVVRTMEINNGDIVVIQALPNTNKAEAIRRFEALRRALARVGKEKCIVIVVDNIDEIKVLGEKEMLEYGWKRYEVQPDLDNAD